MIPVWQNFHLIRKLYVNPLRWWNGCFVLVCTTKYDINWWRPLLPVNMAVVAFVFDRQKWTHWITTIRSQCKTSIQSMPTNMENRTASKLTSTSYFFIVYGRVYCYLHKVIIKSHDLSAEPRILITRLVSLSLIGLAHTRMIPDVEYGTPCHITCKLAPAPVCQDVLSNL